MRETLPRALNLLANLGRADDPETTSVLLEQLKVFDWINCMGPDDWDSTMSSRALSDIFWIFRGIVLAEARLHWGGGSVAGAIWIFHELRRRDPVLAEGAADWALRHTSNPYVPFGSQNLGAWSLSDYNRRHDLSERRRERRHAEIDEGERRAAANRSERRHQRALAADGRRSPTRRAFIEKLSSLSVGDQLRQLAADETYAVEWYPTRLAGLATTEVLLTLDPSIRLRIHHKLKGKRRGPWALFKRRLANL